MSIESDLIALADTTPVRVTSGGSCRRVVLKTDADVTILGDALGTDGFPWGATDGEADFDFLNPSDQIFVKAVTTANVNVLKYYR